MSILKSFDGSPSLMKTISPPPFQSPSTLYGLEYPSILNYACGKDESSFVSDSINISILPLTNGTKNTNLFRKELTLRWLIISLLGFCFLRSFKKCDLHNLIEVIEFKDESAEILPGLDAEIDSLIFSLILS